MAKNAQKLVLVIGGGGYIGSHMVRLLNEKGYRVLVLDNFSTGFRALVKEENVVEGSLGDAELLDRLFHANDIEIIMHFAAYSLVGESVKNPLKYYENNIAETINLIKAMVRHDVRKFIFSSTAAVYGEPVHVPIDENHPCRPTNPYGKTKLAVENLLADCDNAYGLKSICLRYFNAAGAHPKGDIGEMHDPESHLIPIILKAAISGSTINLFGTDYPTEDGTCIRDYIHVSDLADAHLLAAEALFEGCQSNVYNLGNSVGYSVRQVIKIAEEVSKRKINFNECDRREGDPAVLVADAKKIKQQLGWKPRFESLRDIVETAWQWHNR